MNIPKISIIVPVYNVEDYIEECIKSIINQTLTDIEIIIVNDGTKDNSMKKIEKYLKDSRVVVINKENGGLSSARNVGLKIAKGNYISFVDSDDFIEKTMLEDLYSCVSEDNYDIVTSNFYFYNNITKKCIERKKEKNFENKGIHSYEVCSVEVWNKIYKREFLYKNNLFFKEGIIYEDGLFTLQCFFLAEKVKYINKYHYYYRTQRSGSIMTTIHKEFKNKSINSLKIIIEELTNFKNKKKWSDFKEIYLELAIFTEKVNLMKNNCIDKKALQEEMRKIEIRLKKIWNDLTDLEKKTLIIWIRKILKQRVYYKFPLFDSFYWKNRIITRKIFRRVVEEKIRHLFL